MAYTLVYVILFFVSLQRNLETLCLTFKIMYYESDN